MLVPCVLIMCIVKRASMACALQSSLSMLLIFHKVITTNWDFYAPMFKISIS